MIDKWLRTDDTATPSIGWTANLAIFRVVYLYAAILPSALESLGWTRRVMPLLPTGAWQPISFYQWIPASLLRDAVLAHSLAVADCWLIVFALLGFYTRSTLALAAVLSTYLFGLPYNFGQVNHRHHEVWLMALLAAGPSGEMLSIDAVVGALRRADRGRVDLEVSGRAALDTLRYVWLLIGLLYLGSGLPKLVAACTSHWLDFASLQNIMRRRWLVSRLYGIRFAPGFRFDLLPPWLIRLAGLGTIVFETSSIFLICLRNTRWIVALGGLAFHEGNAAILGIKFTSLMIAYVCLFDWSWLCRVAMNYMGRTPVDVIYDSGCELCRRVIAILRTLDISDFLNPVAADTSTDDFRRRYPHITHEMTTRDLYVAGDNTIAAGYDAYIVIATSIPVLWPAALLMRLPPIAAIGRRCYRRIADSRYCRVSEDLVSPPSSIVASSQMRFRTPHLIGIFLLVAEGITLALNSGLAFEIMGTMTGSQAADRAFVEWKNLEWVWPFGQYPTFVYSWDIGSYRTWEPRLVYANGVETTIPPQVFAGAFANQVAIAEGDVQKAVLNHDPVFRRNEALTIAGMLWKNLPNSATHNLVAIRAYESVFSTDPAKTDPISRKLIDSFTLEDLRAETANSQTAR